MAVAVLQRARSRACCSLLFAFPLCPPLTVAFLLPSSLLSLCVQLKRAWTEGPQAMPMAEVVVLPEDPAPPAPGSLWEGPHCPRAQVWTPPAAQGGQGEGRQGQA